ncbi:MAG: phosphate acyltransferase PlsX [Gemmatimonadetes bacterium]|nr:phosphate acyltransferase PlsX [Gemmatimonadota bacterium]
MRVVLDAMGTDRAPGIEVAGAVDALRELDADINIALVGDEDAIRAELERALDFPAERLELVHAGERIEAGEPPASAVRRKPNSSIVVGLKLQREGRADAFISAGSTGAVMAASLILLRPLPGVDRPAIGTMLPTASLPTLLLDAGANVDCKPMHLVQFGHLGTIYAQDLMARPNPRVALLNIGEEPEKGNELALEAHSMLSASGLNFVGNVEGRDIISGCCDVVVCDGFVGNVLLKFYESVAEFVMGLLHNELARTRTELNLNEVFRVLDYAEYGGAPLLGVNGVSIICHGESSPRAIRNAVRVATQAVRRSMVQHIARQLSSALGAQEAV